MKRLWSAIFSVVLYAITASQASAALMGYLSDYNNGKVMRLDSDGTVTPLANVFAADGAALDSSGNLYVGSGTTIQKVTPAGSASTFTSGSVTYDGHVAFDAAGNLFAASEVNDLINKITPGGAVSTFASGFSPSPVGEAFDASGNLFVSLYDSANPSGSSIVRITPGGPVTFASGLNTANGLAFDASGNLFVASEYSNSIYKITPGGLVSTFVTNPLLNGPYALAFDGAGNLYSANYFDGSVSKISPAGAVSKFASSGLGQGLAGIVVLRGGPDTDGDGIPDSWDNCPYTVNPDQKDSGGINTTVPDGIGDACQCGDVNNDGIVTIADKTILSRSLAGLGPYGSVVAMPGFSKCDVSGDGLCNLGDKTVISRALAALAPAIQQSCTAAVPH